MMNVLGIIPARGGSKGVPRKNIRELLGKPLLAYTVECALKSTRLSCVVLSTDDKEIAAIGRGLGADVPFLRPAELADDAAPTYPVVMHAVQYLEGHGRSFDAVCLLQPTNPLRQPADIDACIELLENTGADSVISVLPVPHQYNPRWVYLKNGEGDLVLSTGESAPIARRQDLPAAFHRDGSVYVTRTEALRRDGNLYGTHVRGYLIDRERSVNIDTPEDWDIAERMLLTGDSVGSET